ncbi:Uncharacterised protein [Bordetella pertussis]|nr:Uncharacterised protein [Bordetella pertussis]
MSWPLSAALGMIRALIGSVDETTTVGTGVPSSTMSCPAQVPMAMIRSMSLAPRRRAATASRTAGRKAVSKLPGCHHASGTNSM